MLELLPCMGFGLLFGWHRPMWPERLAPPLVRFGVPLSIAGLVLRSGVHWDVLGAALLTLGLIGGSLLLLLWSLWHRWLPWGVTRLGAVTGNTGYFGVPVVLALLPPAGLAFAVIYDIIGSLITWTLGPPLISGARISGRSLVAHLACSPSVQGMALAVLLQLTPLAPVMASWLWWPARVVIVLALLLLGMRLGVMLRSGEVNARALQVLRPALLVKLLLLPAVMWTLAAITAQPLLVRDVLVLQAATPTAISVLLIAEASSRDVSEAAGLVFASTLLALFSVPLWWLLLQALG